jgi:hypothetical protein
VRKVTLSEVGVELVLLKSDTSEALHPTILLATL